MSLFVTLVHEILMPDPDLETARFEILDFSCPSSGKPRDLTIVDASLIERVSDEQKKAMLETFADGFMLARAMLSKSSPTAERATRRPLTRTNRDCSIELAISLHSGFVRGTNAVGIRGNSGIRGIR